ncbi:MAG: ABC transporter ATP-binding protein [Spirochaetota bacterium]
MILQVQDVSFSYRSEPVLDRVAFQAGEGELIAVLGPNGVGKTTLLRCVNAVLRPRAGCILVDGRNVLRLSGPEIAREIGYVAQRSEPARLTAFDAILLGRKPHITWKASRRDLEIVDAAIKRLGLEQLLLRHVDEMSGGELQKVCIARAIVQEPRVMLLDEPTASLDLGNQLDILAFIKHVVDAHRITALMAVHDLNTALRYADRFLFMKEGRIFASGHVEDVTPEIIEAVYGVRVIIERVRGNPVVIPIDN